METSATPIFPRRSVGHSLQRCRSCDTRTSAPGNLSRLLLEPVECGRSRGRLVGSSRRASRGVRSTRREPRAPPRPPTARRTASSASVSENPTPCRAERIDASISGPASREAMPTGRHSGERRLRTQSPPAVAPDRAARSPSRAMERMPPPWPRTAFLFPRGVPPAEDGRWSARRWSGRVPSDGRSSLASRRSNVDFPTPLSPISAMRSPGAICAENGANSVSAPNDLLRSEICTRDMR